MTTWPFLRSAEHCVGKVREAPEPAWKTPDENQVSWEGEMDSYLLEGFVVLLVVRHEGPLG
jgi:hypothetical protein